MKVLNITLRIILGLLMVMPILGALGIFPEPTPDLYNTPEAFAFIDALYKSGYVTIIMAVVFAISFALLVINQMAIAALLILPITVNIVSFHLFLDGGLFTAGSIMANILFLLNIYFLWQNRSIYKGLWKNGYQQKN